MKIFRASLYSFIFLNLTVIAIILYAWRIEPRWVQWNKIEMPIKNLPKNLENKILVQVSDLHVGGRVDENYILSTFDKINQMAPDIVIYTGDFINADDTQNLPIKELKKIFTHHAKGRLATVAILGNHDYGVLARVGLVADTLSQILSEQKITVLRNTCMDIAGLQIIGIDDYWGRNFHPDIAMSNYNPSRATLVLCHNPDVCDLAIWNGYKGWILSGHTHGGQVRFPFRKATRLPVDNKEYDEGIKHLADGRTLYINKGLGHSMQFRFNVRPEVAVFTLKGKQLSISTPLR